MDPGEKNLLAQHKETTFLEVDEAIYSLKFFNLSSVENVISSRHRETLSSSWATSKYENGI